MREGNCYPTAARIILAYAYSEDAQEIRLVHGTVTGQSGTALAGVRFGHAWVEELVDGVWWAIDKSNGNDVRIPAGLYYAIGQIRPNEVVRYEPDEAIEMLATHKHYGPWHLDAP